MPITGAIPMAGAIVAVLFLVVMGLFFVVFLRRSQMGHEERMRMIEKGIVPPAPPIQGWPGVKAQEQQLRFEERRLMIEKGLTPPPERVPWQPDDYLRGGLTTLFVGIGGGIAYVLVGGIPISDAPLIRAWIAVLAPVLALHGLGCLAYYAVVRKRPSAGQAR